MSITTDLSPTGSPTLLFLRRRDIAAVGGDHSALYVHTLERALIEHAKGAVVQPLKPYLRTGGAGGHIADRIIAMPAHLADPGISGLKWIGSKHDNPQRHGLARASAVIVLNDPDTNYPIAILEGALISAWRTAAVTCIAVARLARRDFRTVALIGCGVIGRTQITALLQQFPQLDTIHLHDVNPSAAKEFAVQLDAEWPGVTARIAESAEQAVRAADVVVPCTVTDRPYLSFDWLRRGSFVSNVSIMDCGKDVFLGADKVVVDDWDQCNREKKIINQLVTEGSFSRDALHAELGEIVAERVPGRENDDEIILLNPMGMAVDDISCATEVYLRAKQKRVGHRLDLY